jgi:hypothetical protein
MAGYYLIMLRQRPTSPNAATLQPYFLISTVQLTEHETAMTKPASKYPADLTDATLLESLNEAFADDSLISEEVKAARLHEADYAIDNFDSFNNFDNFDNEDLDISAQHHGAAAIPRRRPRYSRMANTTEQPRVCIVARIVYILVTASVYGLVGIIMDLIVATGQSLLFIGANHSIFWLFAPFAFVIGIMVGTFAMCLTDGDSNVSYRNGRIRLPFLDPKELQQDIHRRLIKGAVLLAIISLIYILFEII